MTVEFKTGHDPFSSEVPKHRSPNMCHFGQVAYTKITSFFPHAGVEAFGEVSVHVQFVSK